MSRLFHDEPQPFGPGQRPEEGASGAAAVVRAIGETDEVGYTAIDRVVTPADFHATILHALGINQHDLHFEHRGRQQIATFNGGDVLQEVFA